MAEVLVEYVEPVVADDGAEYVARACGAEMENGRWHGWLEFTDRATGETVRSGRETTQPNRIDTEYWATGLTAVYLEGALDRALHPLVKASPTPAPEPRFQEPAPNLVPDDAPTDSVLNPFSVYRKGEAILRRQLGAMSEWHLVNIVRAHGLSQSPATALNALAAEDLIELIVAAVRSRSEQPVVR